MTYRRLNFVSNVTMALTIKMFDVWRRTLVSISELNKNALFQYDLHEIERSKYNFYKEYYRNHTYFSYIYM